MLNNLKIKNSYAVTFLVCFFFLIGNIIWYFLNTPILITELDSSTHFLEIFYNLPAYNAPAITFIFKILFSVFGKKYFDLIIILVNYIFFIGSLIMVYKITKKIKDEHTAFISMILFALTPIIYALSRVYGINDYHLILPITFNMYALIKSDFFKNRKWSILYGVSIAFGMLIKDSFIIFFPGALFYVLMKIYFLKNGNKKPILLNICFSNLIALILISFHYFRLNIIKKILTRPFMDSGNIFEFEKISIFTVGLYEEMLSIPIFILLLIALFYYVKKYTNTNKYILLSYFLFPWAILLLMPCDKVIAYGTAFVPALAIIISIGITYLSKKLKQILFIITAILCILQYISFSYNINMGFDKAFFTYSSNIFRIYNNTKDTLFYLPNKKHLSLLKINKNGEIAPDYDLDNCFVLLKYIKSLKNINIILAVNKENESVIWKSFLHANNIRNVDSKHFDNLKISDKTNLIICIGDNLYFENYVLTKKTTAMTDFYKSDEFYLNNSFMMDNKVSVYKQKFIKI